MNEKFIFEIIEKIEGTKIEEVEIEKDGIKIKVKQYIGPKEVHNVLPASTPSVEIKEYITPTQNPPVETKKEEKNYHVIKSPLIGTFYRAPSPGAPPFVEEGDIVSKGQVLCIIEALKVMNEIESDINGKIVKILVENGQPVEYGQELFYIEPM
jgi:acetyl-CoA carboxylase biotin carboxyl carrier protein